MRIALWPLKAPGLGAELGHAFDGHHQRAVDVLLGGDDVADPQADQLAGADLRLRQPDVASRTSELRRASG